MARVPRHFYSQLRHALLRRAVRAALSIGVGIISTILTAPSSYARGAQALVPDTAATGGPAAQEESASVVNVKDFGATGNGVTDDTAALNAAVTYLKAHRAVGAGVQGVTSQSYAATLVIPQGRYKVTSTLNWTGLTSLSLEIDCRGCVIDGMTRGTPVIDALGSRWLRVRGLTIFGNSSQSPSIGLQIGRSNGDSADDHHFTDLTLVGTFTFTALYDFASETTLFDHLLVWNEGVTSSSFGVVLDGINHWGAASSYVPVTVRKDSEQSFNEALFVNASIMSNSHSGAPIWIAGVSRARFLSSYAASGRSACGTVLYANGRWPIVDLSMDVHYETKALRNVFCVDGPAGTDIASIRGLQYSDQYPEVSDSIFSVTSNVHSVDLRDTQIRIDNFLSSSARVFENPEIWTVSGQYAEVSGNHWNLAAIRFQGSTDVTGNFSYFGRFQSTAPAPKSSSSSCSAGQIAVDGNFFYVCTSPNTWKRSPIVKW